MSKDGVSSKDIITEINQTHTVYSLKADQLFKLRDEGVQDSVLNYMEETKINAVQQNQRYADSSNWWMALMGSIMELLAWAGAGLMATWAGGWGPALVYNYRGGFGGGFHGGFHGGFMEAAVSMVEEEEEVIQTPQKPCCYDNKRELITQLILRKGEAK